ncbi:hypothetical protein H8356DRAFT_1367053 [Neocallimastix lanati (nom. inval.)]|uniref:CCHC-type domain-containing protein n=1 Tax=Neocallimastix californiae TaxID=1754190 RepID=A0A1Y2DHL4_9FUNG|nr:hypothetical protein H8356DRAFT_1367053 [Neocallimastix sp. JGI-2020a]ORY58614.1 hypothetical protein LY90DRAFT_506191 [Neocallimastix californiae]|eukprot:ORY58614.1 hypothetical protein LY90DRAFT_506191 [Neocallimastix californiae]
MKILELEELLPMLDEDARDVDIWAEEFTRLMKLAGINNPASIHTWATECVEGKLRGVLQDLVKVNEDEEEEFPSMKKIKEALEEALEITPQDKCKRLQRLKIKRGESIKNFNWRYKKLYNNLPRLYQSFITVEDYTESISYRPFARKETNETVMSTLYTRGVYSNFSQSNRTGKHPFRQFSANNYIEVNNPKRNMRSRTNDKLLNKNPKYETNNTYKRTYKCFRCNQEGHGVKQCPYSFKELAELEEKGQISKESLNSQMEEGKLPL